LRQEWPRTGEAVVKQLDNPALLGDAVRAVLDSDNPPVHLVIGSDALRLMEAGQRLWSGGDLGDTSFGLTTSRRAVCLPSTGSLSYPG
jgi:hypothetical protein